jgi:hypothetical protein
MLGAAHKSGGWGLLGEVSPGAPGAACLGVLRVGVEAASGWEKFACTMLIAAFVERALTKFSFLSNILQREKVTKVLP